MRVAGRLGGRAESLAWIAVAGASLWLKSGFPLYPIVAASLDDGIFLKQARFLLAGAWLGPYDNTTLIKGAGFPLFMAAAHCLAIPLPLAEHLLWLIAAAVTARLAGRLSGQRWLGFVLFAALAFNPVIWDVSLAFVMRDALYVSLSLLPVALAAAAAAAPGPSRGAALAQGGGLGLALGAFWLTRQEGIWLAPALALALLPALAGLRRGGLRNPATVALVTAALAFSGTLAGVAAINWRQYGVFVTNELKSAPFLHAYGALSRIEHDEWRDMVVFPKDARARAYRVSPAAQELAASLDGPTGAMWRATGCGAQQVADCTEILSGWFIWALRDAVAAAGHAHSAPEALAYYDRLAREIDSACDAGAIPCQPARASMSPVFRWAQLRKTLDRVPLLTRISLHFGQFYDAWASSPVFDDLIRYAPRAGMADAVDAVGGAARVLGRDWFLRGWVGAASGRPSLALRFAGKAAVGLDIAMQPGADVEAAMPGWSVERFDARVSCPPDGCELVATAPGGAAAAVKLGDAHAAQRIEAPGLALTIDAAEARDPAGLTGRRMAWQRSIAAAIHRCYAQSMTPLIVAGLAGVLLGLIRRRARAIPGGLLALAAASAMAVASRVLLLSYLDATSFEATQIRYTAPAAPFVIVLAVVGCWCGIRALWPAAWRG